jgi:hypothetical protein
MENFADIEGPVRIGLMWMIVFSVIGVLLLAVAGLLLARILRRVKKPAEAAAATRRSPLEIAISRLELLKASNEEIEADAFTVEVADIVRDYLEATLEIPAREQTSEEFLLALQLRGDLPNILRDHMPGFLEQCDRVKFARQVLAGGQRETLLTTAGTVVRETEASLNPEPAAEEPAPTA